MKKVLTITISGVVFYINDDAYHLLHAYLQELKKHFRNNPNGAEIIHELEQRIAELLTAFLGKRKVVEVRDIKNLTDVLEKPDEFEGGGDYKENNSYSRSQSTKKLYRDNDDKIIAGVCSGIAAYFNTEPIWIRTVFVFFLLAFSASFWVYIFLWLFVPKAKTTREKFEMRGEKNIISNIEATFKEDLKDIKDKFENFINSGKNPFKSE